MTHEEMGKVMANLFHRATARLAGRNIVASKLMPRRRAVYVMEGLCPYCREELQRLGKENNVVTYRCRHCDKGFRIVDPKDEIDRLTGER